MNIILSIILFLIFYKFISSCIKEGDKFFKDAENNIIKTVKVSNPLRGYQKQSKIYKDDFGMFERVQGGYETYIDRKGIKYIQGAFIGDNPYFISYPSVLYADIEHMGQERWNDSYGHYEAMVSRNRQNKIAPVGNYFLYIPERCPICGEVIEYLPSQYPLGSGNDKVHTATLLDSHHRYCKKCNDILLAKTETYYPFYIDTLNKKLITSKNKKQFEDYMRDCINMNFIQDWIEEAGRRDELDWTNFDESLLRKRELSEYTKNSEVALMWQRLKICK